MLALPQSHRIEFNWAGKSQIPMLNDQKLAIYGFGYLNLVFGICLKFVIYNLQHSAATICRFELCQPYASKLSRS